MREKKPSIKIEVLFFSDCPSWNFTIKDLNAVLDELALKAQISLTKVDTNTDAETHKFPGSPTIRVNGHDLFPIDLAGYALRCRVYQTPYGLKGTPTREMLKEQISRILK
ncbi:MAG: DUF2703 domain-containing protein [Anaerolineaceae bacterium]|nr:DUF2703 domain-containing protein [Anaerolineaceae bacterium]